MGCGGMSATPTIDVRCSHCGAAPGHPCTYYAGRHDPRYGNLHAVRQDAPAGPRVMRSHMVEFRSAGYCGTADTLRAAAAWLDDNPEPTLQTLYCDYYEGDDAVVLTLVVQYVGDPDVDVCPTCTRAAEAEAPAVAPPREWRCNATDCGWSGAGREAMLDHEWSAHEGAAVCLPVDDELDAYSAARKAGATPEQAQAAADPYRREAIR